MGPGFLLKNVWLLLYSYHVRLGAGPCPAQSSLKRVLQIVTSYVPSDLQKLLEMVREEARRTVMKDSETQKSAPRYVLWTPGANKGYQNNHGTIDNSRSQLPSVFSGVSTERCSFLTYIISPGSHNHPRRSILSSLFYK